MQELTLAAKLENVAAVTEFVDGLLEDALCPLKAQMQIDVAIDELFSNIARYAYNGGEGEATVKVDFIDDPRQVSITFIDSGIPYNPIEQEDPDITLSAEDRKIGGLGIFIVKKTMDDISYQHKDGQNILTIKKKI